MMSFSNTKQLIQILKKSKVVGKYSSGAGNVSDYMSPDCLIKKHDDNQIAIYNANDHSYIRLLVEADDIKLKDSIVVEIDMLIKYLNKFEAVTLKVKDNILIGTEDNKSFSMPLLNRHSFSDTIYTLMSKLKVQADGVIVNNTMIRTQVKIPIDELREAFSNCETVGSSIYTLKWDLENLHLSSNKGSESMKINIDTLEDTMEFNKKEFQITISSPIHNILTDLDRVVYIYAKNHSPLFIRTSNNQVFYLIAPRVEE